MQFYSDPSKEPDPHSLPDAEVFHCRVESRDDIEDIGSPQYNQAFGMIPGFYYWHCFPGCLPDSMAIGPFETEQEAIDDCRETKWREYQQDRADEYRDEVTS